VDYDVAPPWAPIFCDSVVTDLRITENTGRVNPLQERTVPSHDVTDAVETAPESVMGNESEPFVQSKVRAWVHYNPTTGEASIYTGQPPQSFGRRRYDIGPIDLDQELINSYVTARGMWDETHATFVAAVRAASALQQSIDNVRSGAGEGEGT
jgi:hypothetical protein